MGTTLTIKDVPEHWVRQLEDRANRHDRTLQEELHHILGTTLKRTTQENLEELLRENRELGVSRGGRDD